MLMPYFLSFGAMVARKATCELGWLWVMSSMAWLRIWVWWMRPCSSVFPDNGLYPNDSMIRMSNWRSSMGEYEWVGVEVEERRALGRMLMLVEG